MTIITFIGAGSTIFAKRLLVDILSFPELSNSTIRLFDIDSERLHTSEVVSRSVAKAMNVHPEIQVMADRRSALDGANYVITMLQIGGYKPATVVDFEIPKRYGLRQTIGDTLGIGGIMRGLRTIPVLLDICRDMEQLLPGCAVAKLRQSHGDDLLGDQSCFTNKECWPLPLCSKYGIGAFKGYWSSF